MVRLELSTEHASEGIPVSPWRQTSSLPRSQNARWHRLGYNSARGCSSAGPRPPDGKHRSPHRTEPRRQARSQLQQETCGGFPNGIT